MKRPVIMIVLCAVLFTGTFVPGAIVYAQDGDDDALKHWFESASTAERYTSIRSELSQLFDLAEKAEIPSELLLKLVQEGALKRVSPGILIDAVTAELQRLRFGKSVLTSAGIYPDENTERIKHLRRISLSLQSGIRDITLREIVLSASTLEKASEAVSAITNVAASTDAGNDILLQLGLALVRSDVKPAGYSFIASVYLKGRLYNLSIREITRIIVNILDSGGGIIQIDRELSRRDRGR